MMLGNYKTIALQIVAALTLLVSVENVLAVDVKLTAELDFITINYDGKQVRVERNQDQSHLIDPAWAKTSRKCPPFCIQPNTPVEGVTNVGEYEVIHFMLNQYKDNTGIIVDARVPSWHKKGTIPGSRNYPFPVFEKAPTDPELSKVLKDFGATPRENSGGFVRGIEKSMAKLGLFGADEKTGYWDFTDAKDLLLWCNGPWCGQSPLAIKGLVALGYPKHKIFYYRGGMQNWEELGLTVVIPE